MWAKHNCLSLVSASLNDKLEYTYGGHFQAAIIAGKEHCQD